MAQLSRMRGQVQPLTDRDHETTLEDRIPGGLPCRMFRGFLVVMDYDTTDADSLGRSLTGIGLNLLVRDVKRQCAFLETVFEMTCHQATADFAIVRYGSQVFQLHADGTYHSNPLLTLLPETPPRGAGLEIRLYDSDPDISASRAEAAGGTVLQPASDKPHGLREAYILCENGYAWVPSRPSSGG